VLDGPLAPLPPQVGGILRLSLLATNAAKYGALSTIKGRGRPVSTTVGLDEDCQPIS
jgi:hypothetical protein